MKNIIAIVLFVALTYAVPLEDKMTNIPVPIPILRAFQVHTIPQHMQDIFTSTIPIELSSTPFWSLSKDRATVIQSHCGLMEVQVAARLWVQ